MTIFLQGFAVFEFKLPGLLARTLDHITNCGVDVLDFARNHGNWPRLLPTPPDCPAAVWNPTSFDEYRKNWECITPNS